MQKWCPEPFDVPRPPVGMSVVEPNRFEAEGSVAALHEVGAQGFRREAGFADTHSLMNSLTKDERAQVYELVEIDLIEEYKERESRLEREFDERLTEAKEDFSEMFAAWTGNVARVLANDMKESAAASSRLAVQIAGKIVRASVAVDQSVLARVIETTLCKISAREPLTVLANPLDAVWLNSQAELQTRLGIESVVGDRRVERGGCVIQCGGREWDATLASQLDTLGDLVGEMIATMEADPGPLQGAISDETMDPADVLEDDHEPRVE